MALSNERIFQGAETEFPWEREAIDFVLAALPDVDPYQAWPLHEVLDPKTGSLHEIDLLVLGKHALYLIEIKSWPGELTGDVRDWTWTADGRAHHLENPYPATNRKAKILASLLRDELRSEHDIWVEPLIFLSSPDLKVCLPDAALTHVVDRHEIARALTHGEYRGSRPQRIVNRPVMKAAVRALAVLGFRPSQAKRRVGEYELGGLLAEGLGYQDHLGVHHTIEGRNARVRSYLVPRATTTDRKQQLERAARREAQVLTRLGEHPSILSCLDFVSSAPLGPALLFEPFDEGIPLDQLFRLRPDLPFDDRVDVIHQVAEAVEYCHRHKVLHRMLCPRSILVRKRGSGKVEVKVHSFQLALREEGATTGTFHLTAHADAEQLVYQAPEVVQDPTKATEASDIFSVGAVAYFVLTGQAPASSLGDLERLLEAQGSLHVAGVRDDLTESLDEVVAFATNLHPAARPDSAIEWFNLLLEAATAPSDTQHALTIDPHDAKPGVTLEGGLLVRSELGSGSTSVVLKVERDGRPFALKVPHDEGCASRLRAEAEILGRLRHPSIVRSHGVVRVGARDCLLLDFAGDETVAGLLRKEGTVGLDYARRFGDDLLSALQYLEEKGIQHRDIKPGNLGFTPEEHKKARHLVLFDFSLSPMAATQVTAGTPAYRDPFLLRRGAWDQAADRYAAAATLYEMLTGSRPDVSDQEETSIREVRVEAERLDASVRDRMAEFFRRAFAPEVGDRFPSSEEMKAEWLAVFVEAPTKVERKKVKPGREVHLDDLVESLDLSNRARNALDRAGVVTVRELLELPRNHLSAIRGVGVKVTREVLEKADELRKLFAGEAVKRCKPLIGAFAGKREALSVAHGLTTDELRTLSDAALTTTGDLAAAPRARVERLIGVAAAERVCEALAEASGRVEARSDLERWADELLATRGRRPTHGERQVRAFLGLDSLPGEAADAVAPQEPVHREATAVAEAFEVSRQRIYQSLTTHRKRWSQAACLEELFEATRALIADLGNLVGFEDAARELARRHGDGTPEQPRIAGALLRVVAELRASLADDVVPLAMGRVNRRVWLAADPGLFDSLRSLAATADRLAAAEELASTERVRELLSRQAEGTVLASWSAPNLVRLAASAASAAEVSARLELYPPNMAADRALRLSQSVLGLPDLKPEDLRRRVRERYPLAESLPEGPELDALLKPYGLIFHLESGTYRRPGIDLPSPTATVVQPTRLDSAGPGQIRRDTPTAREAAGFHEALMAGVEGGRFRVVQVAADWAESAATRIAEELNVEPLSLDHSLWHHVTAQMERLNVAHDVVIAADREGPSGRHWDRLRRLVRSAAADLVNEILANRGRPWLLIHPGSFARYGLGDELQSLIEGAEHGEGAAVILLLPCREDGMPPAINGVLPVPAPIPGQRLWMPKSWIRNEHRAAREGES